ncbi:MAG TPA: hypothetical protein VG603_11265, partial [Chitinophagales bacterium]|nr:hypothetical protein [Chitinophagales bacterium]
MVKDKNIFSISKKSLNKFADMNSNCSFKPAVAELFLSARLSLQGMVMDYDRKYCNLEPLAAYFFNRIHLSAQHTI